MRTKYFLLLLTSVAGMATAQMGMGIYFWKLSKSSSSNSSHLFKQAQVNVEKDYADVIDSWSWVPLPLLIIFILCYNIGAGVVTNFICIARQMTNPIVLSGLKILQFNNFLLGGI